jgi:hypothetical protein
LGSLGEVLGGGRKKSGRKRGAGQHEGFFQEGVGLTDKGEIEEGFWKFYSQVGPKLAARITREREGAFLDYMG